MWDDMGSQIRTRIQAKASLLLLANITQRRGEQYRNSHHCIRATKALLKRGVHWSYVNAVRRANSEVQSCCHKSCFFSMNSLELCLQGTFFLSFNHIIHWAPISSVLSSNLTFPQCFFFSLLCPSDHFYPNYHLCKTSIIAPGERHCYWPVHRGLCAPDRLQWCINRITETGLGERVIPNKAAHWLCVTWNNNSFIMLQV